ncbi:hypothetical protein BDW62DRAFT_214957 [Aspergillus aurantiobrunneus]
MDPLSIATTSAALRVLCYELISFTDSIVRNKPPDSDLTIAGLGRGMWPSVQSTLERSEITLRQLKERVEPVVNSGRKRTLFKVHAKAWKLGLHVRAISTYRGCLETHHTALKVGVMIRRMWVLIWPWTLWSTI